MSNSFVLKGLDESPQPQIGKDSPKVVERQFLRKHSIEPEDYADFLQLKEKLTLYDDMMDFLDHEGLSQAVQKSESINNSKSRHNS